jgi:hypothetical protein
MQEHTISLCIDHRPIVSDKDISFLCYDTEDAQPTHIQNGKF